MPYLCYECDSRMVRRLYLPKKIIYKCSKCKKKYDENEYLEIAEKHRKKRIKHYRELCNEGVGYHYSNVVFPTRFSGAREWILN